MGVPPGELELLEAEWKRRKEPIHVTGALKKAIVDTLVMARVRDLRPHEETILASMAGVAEGILETRRFTWPIFVDRSTGTILDGMHRWDLLDRFAFRFVPVAQVEYATDPRLVLDVWCRLLEDITQEEFQEAIKRFGLEEVAFSVNYLHRRERTLFLSPTNRCYGFSEKLGVFDEFTRLKDLEAHLGTPKKHRLGRARYVEEAQAKEGMFNPDTLAVFPRPLTKDDVLAVTKAGKVFPPKSTRHVFPFRVYGIDVTMEQLQEGRDADGMTQAFQQTHRERPLVYRGRGVTLDRLYEEHVFEFRDPPQPIKGVGGVPLGL